MDDFRRISHVPACAANFPVGHGGTYREPRGGEFTVVALAWLQWQLKGDKKAAKMFVGNDCDLSKQFYASGLYSYEVISSQTSPSDGTVFTLISIEGQKCTYWFRDGLLTLDFGMAYDAPGYYFKKLKK